jgi:alanyl-tRNA synthetase
LDHTSQAGLFKITGESGIQAGVRRIEAVTGRGAIEYVRSEEERLEQVARAVKSSPRDVLAAVEKLLQQRAELQRQVQQLKSGAASGAAAELQPEQVEGVALVVAQVLGADRDALSALADRTAQWLGSAVVVLAAAADGKVELVAKVTPDLVKRGMHAGNLVREAAKVAGGGGGGRPDFAQAGARDPSRVADALARAREVVAEQLTANGTA